MWKNWKGKYKKEKWEKIRKRENSKREKCEKIGKRKKKERS